MRLVHLATVLGLLLYLPTAAATNVSTPITSNTIWTLAGSPYVLRATITVNTGVTLTIEPGVTVQNYDGNQLANGLAVDGSVVAQGTAGSRITFTRGAQRGLGLVRAATGGAVTLDYCDFVDATGVGGIEASFDIRHCTFTSTSDSFPCNGIYMVSPAGTPVITSCVISHTNTAGLDLTLAAAGTIDSLSIVMDPTVDTSAVTLTSSSPTIRHSSLVGSGLAPAVFLAGNSRPVIDSCVVDGGMGSALWCSASGDIPSMAGDSLRTTSPLLARLPLPGWVVREGGAMHRASVPPDAVVDVLGSTCAVSGTWPALAATVLRGNATIAAAAAVTIAPGAEVRNGGGGGAAYGITVQGTLTAAGTEGEPIVFTRGSTAPGDRFGTLNHGAGASGTLDWCEFGYANGVMFGGAGATVRHCTFLHGSIGLGIANPPSAPTVTACTFDSVEGDAIMLYTAASGTFDSLAVRSSTGNGIVLDGASPTITNSVIAGNAGWGVLCQNSANPAIHADSIVGNTSGGVRNETSAITVDAEMNWWGDVTGPYHATLNVSGTGNAVSDYVDFDPWVGGPTAWRPATAAATVRGGPDLAFRAGVLRWWSPTGAKASLTLYDLAGRVVFSAAASGSGTLPLSRVAGAGRLVAVLRAQSATIWSTGVLE